MRWEGAFPDGSGTSGLRITARGMIFETSAHNLLVRVVILRVCHFGMVRIACGKGGEFTLVLESGFVKLSLESF